jgi:hypothetical protein
MRASTEPRILAGISVGHHLDDNLILLTRALEGDRDLAARASIPAEKKRLQQMAAAWAKMAAERERYLTDAAETAAQINRRASDQYFGPAAPNIS